MAAGKDESSSVKDEQTMVSICKELFSNENIKAELVLTSQLNKKSAKARPPLNGHNY